MKKIKHTFRLTDLVHIKPNTKKTRNHFESDVDAIVIGRDSESDKYELHIKGSGYSAWYPASELELISHNQSELLDKWESGDYGLKKKRGIPKTLRNFTAILPVTCNADCSFCPEKEMEEKAGQKEWQDGLIAHIKKHQSRFDHVSISGGEPTLRTKFLFETIDRIQKETKIKKVGLTSNGQFLEKASSTFAFLDANTTPDMTSKLSHLNISLHSFNRERANKIMGVNYQHTLEDLVRFRRQLGKGVSFHINFVINDQTGPLKDEFLAALAFMKANPFIDVVFRVDYNDVALSKDLRDYAMKLEAYYAESEDAVKRRLKLKSPKVKKPKIVHTFNGLFGYTAFNEEGAWTTGCPSCFTHCSDEINNSHAYLKASSYEPNDDEEEYTEMVYHMDGKLYFDWTRKDEVPVVKKAKEPKFDFEMKEPEPKKAVVKKAVVKKVKKASVPDTSYSGGRSRCGYGTIGPCGY